MKAQVALAQPQRGLLCLPKPSSAAVRNPARPRVVRAARVQYSKVSPRQAAPGSPCSGAAALLQPRRRRRVHPLCRPPALPAQLQDPPQEPEAGDARAAEPAAGREGAEEGLPSDEEVLQALASDPTDRAPGQQEPGSEDEAESTEFHKGERRGSTGSSGRHCCCCCSC